MKQKRLFAFILSLATVLLLIDFTPLKGNSESKTTENIIETETAEAMLKAVDDGAYSSSLSISSEDSSELLGITSETEESAYVVCDAAQEEPVASENAAVKDQRHNEYMEKEFVEIDGSHKHVLHVRKAKTEDVSIINILEDTGACTIEYAGTEISVAERDFKILCRIVEAEASIEDTLGKQLVANVVLNRVVSNRFPNSIEGVVFDGDAFTSTLNGRYSSVEVEQSTIDAVLDVLNGADESQGAVYFLNKKTARSKYVKMFDTEMIHLFHHGHHDFYKEDD